VKDNALWQPLDAFRRWVVGGFDERCVPKQSFDVEEGNI
jgi:hypothetical protein